MGSANDLRKGQVIKFNNEPYLVMETQHRTPGNLRAFVQAKLRNLKNGRSFDQRFNSTETMEVLNTDRRPSSSATRTARTSRSWTPAPMNPSS